MELYKDKTILITGASSGIGEEFANTLERVADNKKNNAKKGANALELAQTQFDRNMLNNKFVKVIELFN